MFNLDSMFSFVQDSFRSISINNEILKPVNQEGVEVEKFGGLSIWATSYKATLKQTTESIALRVLNLDQPKDAREKELALIEKMSIQGIAPRLIKMDKSKGLVSVVYIKSPDQRPWHPVSMTANKITQLAMSVKSLHVQTPEGKKIVRFDELDDKVLKLVASHPLFEIFKIGIEKMREIDAVQSKHVPLKFCHNDIGHGGNTLWDGERVWIIDWELAGDFNPYFDIASPMVLLFFKEEFKDLFFKTYLGSEPTQKEKDLLLINMQYAYLRYGVTSLGICHNPTVEFTLSLKEIEKIGMWTEILTGKVTLKHEEMQTDFGRCKTGILLIHQALKNMEGEEFKSAISRLKTNESIKKKNEL